MFQLANVEPQVIKMQEEMRDGGVGCFSQEGVHYDAGMRGKFVVKP